MFKNKFLHYLFIFGLVINLVVPRMNIQGINIYPIYPVSAIMLVLWFYLALDRQFNIRVNKSIYYLLLILTAMMFSFFFPIVFFHTEFSVKYFIYEILTYLVVFPFFLMINHFNISQTEIDKVITFSFSIFVLVGVLQWLGFAPSITLYSFDHHINTALAGLRLTLTGSDPNVGSITAAFFITFFFTKFIYSKSTSSLFYTFIALALLFKTQGRTTIIGVAIVIALSLVFLVKIKLIYRILIIIFGALSVLYFAQQFDLFYLIQGLETLEQGKNNSVNVRLDNARYAYENFKSSPIFGWGSSLEQFGSVRHLDSEVFLILQRYGLFGVLVILYIISSILYAGFKYRHTQLGLFLLMMMGSLMFNMLTNLVFFGAQTVSVIFFLIYIRYYLNSYEKNNLSSPTAS